MAEVNEYELARMRRIEENRKRMQELGIVEASRELTAVAPRPPKPRALSRRSGYDSDNPFHITRRSDRVAYMDRPDYRDMDGDYDPDWRPRAQRPSYGSYTPRNPGNHQRRAWVSTTAREHAERLAFSFAEHQPTPCMAKVLTPSQMSGGYWMGLQSDFCKHNMPTTEENIILEDAEGREWDAIYKPHKRALSGGWRSFAIDHGLEEGDAIVFEQIAPFRMKVHLFRAADQGAAMLAQQAEALADEEEEAHGKGGVRMENGARESSHFEAQEYYSSQDDYYAVEADEEAEEEEEEQEVGEADYYYEPHSAAPPAAPPGRVSRNKAKGFRSIGLQRRRRHFNLDIVRADEEETGGGGSRKQVASIQALTDAYYDGEEKAGGDEEDEAYGHSSKRRKSASQGVTKKARTTKGVARGAESAAAAPLPPPSRPQRRAPGVKPSSIVVEALTDKRCQEGVVEFKVKLKEWDEMVWVTEDSLSADRKVYFL